MTEAFSRAKRIQILLETLIGEHYVRASLLRELGDELSADPELLEAAAATQRLAGSNVNDMDDRVFAANVDRLADLVRAKSRSNKPSSAE